jgi:hypothetical protein
MILVLTISNKGMYAYSTFDHIFLLLQAICRDIGKQTIKIMAKFNDCFPRSATPVSCQLLNRHQKNIRGLELF